MDDKLFSEILCNPPNFNCVNSGSPPIFLKVESVIVVFPLKIKTYSL